MKTLRSSSFSFALLACICFQANATEVAISPTTLKAKDTTKSQVLTLTNTSKIPISYQIQAYKWNQEGGVDSMVQTRDLIATPSIVEIQPGAKQVVRVIHMAQNVGATSYYRVVARELPSSSLPNRSGVSMTLNHNLAASFEPVNSLPPVVTLARQGNQLAVTNSGGIAARLTGIKSESGSVSKVGALGWVLPGSMLLVPVDPKNESQLTLTINEKPITLDVK